MNAGREVLIEADDISPLIVDNLHGILDQQLRPRLIHKLNINIITPITSYIIIIIKLITNHLK